MMGIAALLFIALYIYICKAVYVKYIKTSDSIYRKILLYIMLVTIGFGDNIAGNLVYYYLVREIGGKRIYQNISKDEGIYINVGNPGYQIQSLSSLLVSSQIKFIEALVDNNENNKSRSAPEWFFQLENGYYRFYTAGDDNSECGEKSVFSEAGKCIIGDRISKIDSKFSISYGEPKHYKIDLFFIEIINVKTYTIIIKNVESGAVVGEATNVFYDGGWFVNNVRGNVKLYPDPPIISSVLIKSVFH